MARPKIETATLSRAFLLIHLLDKPVERRERAVADPDLLADFEGDRRFRPLDPLLDLVHDARRLVVADRRRFDPATAEEPGDLSRLLDQVPSLVVHIHLDQDIAREKFAFRADLGAAFDFDHLLGRYEDLLELVGRPLLLGLLANRG